MSEFGQKLIEETRRVAAERADFVFDGDCLYVCDGEPACLLGHALWNLGVIDSALEISYIHISAGERLGSNNNVAIRDLADKLGLCMDESEFAWLEDAQWAQDVGRSWGYAVAYADSIAGAA